jgi:phage/plasmid primase-like uncharacterized protein/RecA-family ATPase
MAVKLDADAPDGFVVHSFAGDRFDICRDHVRERIGRPPWPNCDQHPLPGERGARRKRIEDAEATKLARQVEVAQEARAVWSKMKEGPHPYLDTKRIKAHGARVTDDGKLLAVPLFGADGALWNLQYIDPEGRKRCLFGGRVEGCFYLIGGDPADGVICFAEGFATGCSICESTNDTAVAVAFTASNLIHVAKALRSKFPKARLVFCADDDVEGKNGNTGRKYASDAAIAVGGLLAIPDFGPDRPKGVKDFNDLADLRGADAVFACVHAASAPILSNGKDTTDAAPGSAGETRERELTQVPASTSRTFSVGAAARSEASAPIKPSAPLPPKPLHIVTASTLQGVPVPVRRWLVPEWIPWSVVTGLYGDGGQGKTLLMQQLQTSAAFRVPWVGLPILLAAPSLCIYCEDIDEEIHRRQADINTHYQREFSDLARSVYWMPRLGEDNLLMTFTSRGTPELTGFYKLVREAALDLKVRLLGVDTVSDTYGGNENDRGQVKQFVSRCLGSLALAIDGCVLANAHPSRFGLEKGTGDSGSTAWNNAFRSRLFMSTPESEERDAAPDASARSLFRKKANYAPRDAEIKLRWHRGVFAPDAPPGGDFATFGGPTADEVFLMLLDATISEGRSVSDNSHAGNYAPRLFARRPERAGFRFGDFTKAMERLFVKKAIRNEEYGRKSDARKRLVRS